VLRSVFGDVLLEVLEGDRHAIERRLGDVGIRPEGAVLVHEVLVPGTALDELLVDAIGDRQVALRAELHVVIGELRGAGIARAQVDQDHLFTARPPVDEAGEEDRVHLGHVVSPQDKHVAGIQVIVASRGLVHPVGGEEAGDGGGHAQPRVRFQVVVRKTAAHQLLRGVSFRDGPLAGTIDRELLRGLHDLPRGEIDRFIPRDPLKCAIAAGHRILQPVLTVKDAADVITLHAEQTLVHGRIGMTRNGDHPSLLHPHLHMAASTAETAGCLVPLDATLRGRFHGGGSGALAGSGTGRGQRGGFQESAAFKVVHHELRAWFVESDQDDADLIDAGKALQPRVKLPGFTLVAAFYRHRQPAVVPFTALDAFVGIDGRGSA
jgi:hypothetical protein